MKKILKRLLAITLSLVMLTMVIPVGTFMVSATSKTPDEAIAWVKSKCGTGIDYDGKYGCQCVDLIMAYYEYLGESPRYDNAGGYTTNSLPSGWERVKGGTPQKGDILVYYGNGEHVGIYESDYSHFHQNFSGSYVCQITKFKYYQFDNPNYWGYIRPFGAHSHSYSSSVTTQPTCTENGVRTYTCSCGNSYTETISKLGHDYVPVVTKPTCVTGGYTTYTCSRCKDTYVSEITDSIKHNYIATNVCLYCDNSAQIDCYCSECEEQCQKTVNTTNGKTEFIDKKIIGLYDDSTQEKVQYRSAIKQISNTELEGWDYEYSDYGKWSDWELGTASKNELTDVETATLYLWYAYICPECGQHDPYKGACSGCGKILTDDHWWSKWYDYPFSSGEYYNGSKTKTTKFYGSLYSANDHNPEPGYKYRKRTRIYYKWSDFSEWQDEEIVADAKTMVETRTLYSYDLSGSTSHTYSEKWSNDETQHWHECSVCHDKTDFGEHEFIKGKCICGAEKFTYGDVNGDTEIDATDLVRLKKYLAGQPVEITEGANCNGDNTIDATDLVRLKKYLAGQPVVLGK